MLSRIVVNGLAQGVRIGAQSGVPMQRDPILFAWASTPRRHAAALGLAVGLGSPLALFVLVCLRDLIAVLIPVRAPTRCRSCASPCRFPAIT